MDVPRASESKDYLQQHKIMELFDNLTAQLVFNRPDNPKEFMANYIQTLKESRTANMNFPCIFDETNIGSVFGMLDPTKKGFITFAQYKEAMVTMGCVGYDTSPPGAEQDCISQDTFTREVKDSLSRASATFQPQ
ncbi:putative EF-hand calcium-binding domain-containing protein 10 [Apostichopus japonicus]|uniref:Putative EF-hand calcium-binding domain-containing protein 10 n=1 Tax=Stichopus japonicus TaxID=307972 RepID=A0A2G8LRD4_STIJA|nr:putative EF-hand calcium-binding domain-containing protein 10 [Apostichopus japonicus]